jgi:hypothetical protein
MTPKTKPEGAIDPVNESRTEQWNKAISPRLVSLRNWFADENWKTGVGAYLNSVLAERREHHEKENNDRDADQFIKGQIAMLKQIIDLPVVIERQIAQSEKNKNSGPTGDAGY